MRNLIGFDKLFFNWRRHFLQTFTELKQRKHHLDPLKYKMKIITKIEFRMEFTKAFMKLLQSFGNF